MRDRCSRYVDWVSRHARKIFAATALALGASVYLIVFHLPLYSDFSYLLPSDAPSVREAEKLAQRMPARDTMLVLVTSPDPAQRAAAAQVMVTGAAAIDRDLVERVEADDAETRALVREHRHLFIPVADLEAARDALATQIEAAKLRANPLYIDLDDEPAADGRLQELRDKQRAAEAKLERSSFVSADGTKQVIIIRTSFRATDVDRDRKLMAKLEALADDARAAHPTVTIGFAGGVPTTVAEHSALARGIVWSTLITSVLVAVVLFVHLRSVRLLVLLGANVIVGTVAALGVAALTVGHLNAATAFLGAIIAGNGVNYGIVLAARYIEERRGAKALEPQAAMTAAIRGTVLPTLVASLGAAIAYGALAATEFRGFADFALIGGAGMLLCWITSYTLLPALILRFAHTPRHAPSELFGRIVVRIFGIRRPVVAAVIAGVVVIASGALAWRFIANDPYEYDLTKLRSRAPDAVAARDWLRLSDETFGRGLAGIGGQTFIAVDSQEQVPAVVSALAAVAARDPIVGPVASILDVIPPDQPRKLELLAEIRRAIDTAAPELADADRDELLALRPPDELRALTVADLPPAISAKLTERDGRVGHIVAVRPGPEFDEQDGKDLIAFAGAVRDVELPNDERISAAGASVLFADVLTQIQTDGPFVTMIAALGIVLMVVLVVGRTRRAAAALIATGAGSLVMIAVSAIAGLKINFLDFVALPITIGLGIDYAINVADRAAADDPLTALRSTGGAVFACSLTTIIGYLSLLASDNLAIRGFGLASLIGEITCMAAAFVIVPALLAMPRARAAELTPASSSRHLPAFS